MVDGFAAPSAGKRALVLKYSGQSVFNPHVMRDGAVEKMLGDLAGRSIMITMAVPVERAAHAQSGSSGFGPLNVRREPPAPGARRALGRRSLIQSRRLQRPRRYLHPPHEPQVIPDF